MGRRIHANDHISSLQDPIISYTLLVACGAATMAIISALCGGRLKKKPPTSPSSSTTSPQGAPDKSANSQLSRSIKIEEDGNVQEDNELPLPPGMRKPDQDGPALKRSYSCKNYMTKSASARDAIMSSSSGNGSVSRTMSAVRDLDKKKKSKVKSQDSVWMKSIILGEKCKVPDDEIGNNIVYDVGKGKKIQTYYPRTQNSLQVSRSNSSLGSTKAEGQDLE